MQTNHVFRFPWESQIWTSGVFLISVGSCLVCWFTASSTYWTHVYSWYKSSWIVCLGRKKVLRLIFKVRYTVSSFCAFSDFQLSVSGWTTCVNAVGLKQTNGWDCGLFMLQLARCYLTQDDDDVHSNFTNDDIDRIRHIVMKELVDWKNWLQVSC